MNRQNVVTGLHYPCFDMKIDSSERLHMGQVTAAI
jgi:hypothetical protein